MPEASIFGTILSIVILALGFLFAPEILLLMNVPDEIMTDSVHYLRLIFIGNLFTFQYNIISSALRAVGDSKTPVYFISLSSVLNACLDYFFIYGMHLGVVGAAYATVIAEAMSAVLCFVYVYRRIPELQIRRNEWVMDGKLLGNMLSSGIVTALQQSCQPIGKLLIQSVINVGGINVIAAFNAVTRIDDYGRIPAQTISHGMMTCTAQNRGAGNVERTRETLKKGLIIGALYYPMIAAVIILFRHPLVEIFAPRVGGEEMIRIGVPYLVIKALTIIFPCVTNGLQGYFRGMNQMKITLASTVLQITVRTLFVYLLVPRIGLNGEAIACAIGWSFMILFEYGYYFLFFRKKVYKLEG